MSIVIFTSLNYISVVPVVAEDAALSSKCLFVGFDESCGTYHAVKQISVERVTSNSLQAFASSSGGVVPDDEIASCNCGRGAAKKDSERRFCKQIVGGIPSRCVCYIKMKGCSFKCRSVCSVKILTELPPMRKLPTP